VTAVLLKELRTYFLTPLAYIFMALFHIIAGLFFTSGNLFSANPNFAPYLSSIIFIFLICVPILTMRLLADEKKNRTDQLLLTAPQSVLSIVMGKFLAAFIVFFITLLITAVYPVIISFHGTLDLSETIGSYAGFLFLGAAFISVGLFVSSLTDNQPIAAITTFAALFITWIIDFLKNLMPVTIISGLIFISVIAVIFVFWVYLNTKSLIIPLLFLIVEILIIGGLFLLNREIFFGLTAKVLSWLSLTQRFSSFTMGILKLENITYYLSFCVFFLYLTTQGIEKRRWS